MSDEGHWWYRARKANLRLGRMYQRVGASDVISEPLYSDLLDLLIDADAEIDRLVKVITDLKATQ